MMRDILEKRQSLISTSTWFWTKSTSTGLDGSSPIPYNSQVFGRHYPQMGTTKWGLDK